MTSTFKAAATLTNFLKNSKGFERLLNKIKIISIGNGECLVEYKVEEDVTNLVHTMHGGFSATLIDCISSYALFSHPKGEVPSVSVDMHLTYLKAAKVGEEILVEGKVARVGQNLSYLTCEIRNKETGQLLVNGLHTKYMLRKN